MPNRCAISGKKPGFGHNVSHSKRRTNRRFNPNVQTKRVYIPELGRFVRLPLSTAAMRTIDKIGLMAYLKHENLRLGDVVSRPLRREIAESAPRASHRGRPAS